MIVKELGILKQKLTLPIEAEESKRTVLLQMLLGLADKFYSCYQLHATFSPKTV